MEKKNKKKTYLNLFFILGSSMKIFCLFHKWKRKFLQALGFSFSISQNYNLL